MTSSFTLKISMPKGDYPADTRIFVTTDGSEPNINSKSGTSHELDINTSTVVRAKLISSQAIAIPSTTHSYIYHPRKVDLPIVSLVTNDYYFFDEEIGIIPNCYDVLRRPFNIECFDPQEKKTLINQLGQIAISGGATRRNSQKSFKCYAKKRFGTKRYYGTFWEDKPLVESTKSFMLRSGGNNSDLAKINDAFVQKLFGTHITNLDFQAYRPSIVYINGVYQGIFEWRERSNDDYVESNYDGLENITILPAKYYYVASTNKVFATFRDIYDKEATTLSDLEKAMDVDNFMKALIAEMYASNTDYPANNVAMWRPNASTGKWRWILKDLDFMARNVSSHNMFVKMFGENPQQFETYTNGVASTYTSYTLYRKMISLPEFRKAFIDHYSVYLGDFLKPSCSLELLNRMLSEIESEILYSHNAYGYQSSGWTTGCNKLRNYCSTRCDIVYQQMADYFSLGSVIPMQLVNNGHEIKINGVGLTEGDFDGACFSGYPLTIETGAKNYGWKMTLTGDGASSKSYTFKQQKVSLQMSDYGSVKSVKFEPLLLNVSPFEQRLKDLNIVTSKQKDYSSASVIELPEPRCAYANITGIEQLPADQTDLRHAYLEVYDGNGNYFKKKVLLSVQGGANSNLNKKNLSIGFCEDEWIGDVTPDITFGDWVKQDEFHLKAFYNDYFRGIPAIGYKLFNQMVLSHQKGKQYPWQRGLSSSDLANEDLKVYDEARCFPDAFPCALYFNGDYYGTFAWQLKKQRKNMNQTKDVATHIHLDGTLNDKQLFQGTVNWTKFEVRNPKDLYNMDGSDYDGDNPQELIDATSSAFTGKKKMVRTAEVKQHILELSKYYDEINALVAKKSATDKVKAAIEQRFDVTSLIDYMILSLVTSNYDGFSKKWQWFTYDGQKWFVAPYDLDLTFGYNEEMTSLWPASQSSKKYDYKMENVDSDGPMLWVKNYYWEELKQRYAELRIAEVVTTDNFMAVVNDWYDRVGDSNRTLEWLRWPQSPCLTNFTDSQQRIRQWIDERITLEDQYLAYNAGGDFYRLQMDESRWATLYLPFDFDVPFGLTVYSVIGTEGNSNELKLTQVDHPEANKPYLVAGDEGSYFLYSAASATAKDKQKNGMLTGTYKETYAPLNSYVLQNQVGVVGFYQVSKEKDIKVSANHAYLTLPSTSAYALLRLPDSSSSIDEIDAVDPAPAEYYNYWGQRVDGNTRGIVIERKANSQIKKIIR